MRRVNHYLIAVVALIAFFIIFFSGCRHKADGSDTTANMQIVDPSRANSSKERHLHIFAADGTSASRLETIAKQFTRETGISVSLDRFPADRLLNSVTEKVWKTHW